MRANQTPRSEGRDITASQSAAVRDALWAVVEGRAVGDVTVDVDGAEPGVELEGLEVEQCRVVRGVHDECLRIRRTAGKNNNKRTRFMTPSFQTQGHVNVGLPYCSKVNAYYVLSCRDNSTLNVSSLPNHCDLASRSRSKKR